MEKVNIPMFYDPESQTHQENTERLQTIYLELYPWHNTNQARYYDYPTFDDVVDDWASDDFYAQHLTAKIWKEAENFLK